MKLTEQIKGKGIKSSEQIIMAAGYRFPDYEESETGFTAEWSRTGAGITLSKLYVKYSKKMRVLEAREEG